VNKDALLSGGWDAAFANQNSETVITSEESEEGIIIAPEVVASVDRFTLQGFSPALANRLPAFWQWFAHMELFTLGVQNQADHMEEGACPAIASTGLANFGRTTLTSSVIRDVGGWGIYNGGVFTMSDSQVSNVAPTGIRNEGVMRVYRSKVVNNFGICTGITNWSNGALTVASSTISHNSYSRGGAFGGGLCNLGNAVLVNTTVSHNVAHSYGGGIYNISGTLSLYNSTVSHNASNVNGAGGGIFNESEGVVRLQNTLVSDNGIAGENPQPATADCGGTLQSQGYNLVTRIEGCNFVAATGDLLNINAALSPFLLGSPGYHPLLKTSPAINAGDSSGCKDHEGNLILTDQRGVERIGRCDIGAYEYDPANDPLFYSYGTMVVSGSRLAQD
jgi:hypothetical protein